MANLSIRTLLSPLLFVSAATMPLAPCVAKPAPNRSVESVHQPVVSYTSFIYDIRTDSSVGVTGAEKERLVGWLDSLNVDYGDTVSIAGGASTEARADIAAVIGKRGMLIREDDSGIAGPAPYGSVRLIVRRATASVPGCPDWSDKQESNLSAGTSGNYGCATNSNIAAMIANPEDLVRGQSTKSDLRTVISSRAVQTYQSKAGGN